MMINPYQTHVLVSWSGSSRGPRITVAHWRKPAKQRALQSRKWEKQPENVFLLCHLCQAALPRGSGQQLFLSIIVQSKSELMGTNKWKFQREKLSCHSHRQWYMKPMQDNICGIFLTSVLLALTGIKCCQWDIFKEHWIVFNQYVFHLHWSIKSYFP